MVYFFCHCMSLHAFPGVNFILDSRLVIFFGKKLSFWLLLVVVDRARKCIYILANIFFITSQFYYVTLRHLHSLRGVITL